MAIFPVLGKLTHIYLRIGEQLVLVNFQIHDSTAKLILSKHGSSDEFWNVKKNGQGIVDAVEGTLSLCIILGGRIFFTKHCILHIPIFSHPKLTQFDSLKKGCSKEVQEHNTWSTLGGCTCVFFQMVLQPYKWTLCYRNIVRNMNWAHRKTLHECETAPTSQYGSLFLVFVFFVLLS